MSNFIMTYSSNIFDYNNIQSNTISIIDISASLSKICRFGGHSVEFYPVLSHCLLVSHIAETELKGSGEEEVYALYGLLHDASEAYVSDLMSPLKRVVGQEYINVEKEIEERIYHQLVPHHKYWEDIHSQVKVYDALAFFIEQPYLLMMPQAAEDNILAYYNHKFGITEHMVMEARQKYGYIVEDRLNECRSESINFIAEGLVREYMLRYKHLSTRVRSIKARELLSNDLEPEQTNSQS